jgi:hypothetical protein
MNEQDLRDCYAMFAMNGLISKRLVSGFDTDELAKEAYEMADSMLEARKPKEVGIKTVKRTRKLND